VCNNWVSLDGLKAEMMLHRQRMTHRWRTARLSPISKSSSTASGSTTTAGGPTRASTITPPTERYGVAPIDPDVIGSPGPGEMTEQTYPPDAYIPNVGETRNIGIRYATALRVPD